MCERRGKHASSKLDVNDDIAFFKVTRLVSVAPRSGSEQETVPSLIFFGGLADMRYLPLGIYQH